MAGDVSNRSLAGRPARHRRDADRRDLPQCFADLPPGRGHRADRADRPGRSCAGPRADRRRVSLLGAAFTSFGLLLATWTPRIGRAVGSSVAVFLLLSFGSIFVVGIAILPALRGLLSARYNVADVDLIWIDLGLMASSPIFAPIATIQTLEIPYAGRLLFWAIMSFWCLLASASAGAMYWAALRLFDLQLGRMSETSKKPTAPQPRGLYIADGGLQADVLARSPAPQRI